jgi:hypothetical protein
VSTIALIGTGDQIPAFDRFGLFTQLADDL